MPDAKVPAGAKKPQDRKSKDDTTAPVDEGVMVVEHLGREWRVERATVEDDFEFWAVLRRVQRGEGLLILDVLEKLIGTTETQVAIDLLRDPDTKRVPPAQVDEFMGVLMQGVNPNS